MRSILYEKACTTIQDVATPLFTFRDGREPLLWLPGWELEGVFVCLLASSCCACYYRVTAVHALPFFPLNCMLAHGCRVDLTEALRGHTVVRLSPFSMLDFTLAVPRHPAPRLLGAHCTFLLFVGYISHTSPFKYF